MIFTQSKLDRCISCGYCLPHCPTYQLTKKEESSPRGRITLMRAVQDGTLPIASLEAESKFCLGCRACEPVCPAGVEYGHLIEEARNEIWNGSKRPLIVRGLFFALNFLKFKNLFVKSRKTDSENYLMLGCFEQLVAPEAVAALKKLDPSLQITKDQGCCGALHSHNGELAKGQEMAKKLGEDLKGKIITTSAGCASHIAQTIGRDRVVEFSEYWSSLNKSLKPIIKNGQKIRVGFQDSCHGRNGLGIWREPRELLKQLGNYVEVPGAADCCGAAGTYALINKKNSRAVVAPKIEEIKTLNLDYLVTINPGCTRQLKSELKRSGVKTEVLHLASLIALSK
jgi:glycolate oxidase iron-sulfur subunit